MIDVLDEVMAQLEGELSEELLGCVESIRVVAEHTAEQEDSVFCGE